MVLDDDDMGEQRPLCTGGAVARGQYLALHGVTVDEIAGLRHIVYFPEKDVLIGLYDGELQGMDPEGGRWNTLCETHGQICNHLTLATARAFATDPESWCEVCANGFLSDVY